MAEGHIVTADDMSALGCVVSYLSSLNRSTRMVDADSPLTQASTDIPKAATPEREALHLLGRVYVQAGRELAREFVRLMRG